MQGGSLRSRDPTVVFPDELFRRISWSGAAKTHKAEKFSLSVLGCCLVVAADILKPQQKYKEMT